MAARGNPRNIVLGPGQLFFAPLGSAEPADHRALVFDTAPWVSVGYTKSGSTHSFESETEGIEVAEELSPVRKIATSQKAGIKFEGAEISALHLALAWNGGSHTLVPASPGVEAHVESEPPGMEDAVERMLGWRSEDGLESWVWRRVLNTTSSESAHGKGADYATLGFDFEALVPVTGEKIFTRKAARGNEGGYLP